MLNLKPNFCNFLDYALKFQQSHAARFKDHIKQGSSRKHILSIQGKRKELGDITTSKQAKTIQTAGLKTRNSCNYKESTFSNFDAENSCQA